MKNGEKQIVIGIIGAGYWGANLVRNFLAVPGVQVKYICDAKTGRLDKYRTIVGVICTQDAEDLFSDAEVDAVVIATPVAAHHNLAKRALLANKHVFVEKPMTRTVEEAEELISLAQERKLILHVDHTFVYYGPVIKMKEIVDSGELGDLHYFDSSRINLGLIQPDVNVFWDLAPHDISILHFLHPERAERVSAVGTRHVAKGGVELAHITLQYPSGFVAHVHTSWLSPVKMRQMTLGGSKRMIYFDDIHPFEKIKIYDKGISMNEIEPNTFEPVYRSGEVRMPVYDNAEALYKECAHFVDAIREGGETITDGQSGLDVVRILEAAERSLGEGGAHIEIRW